MKFTARYANNSPIILQNPLMPVDGYFSPFALVALPHQISLSITYVPSSERVLLDMLLIVKQGYSVPSTMEPETNLPAGLNYRLIR
jgi:hypothetical protein